MSFLNMTVWGYFVVEECRGPPVTNAESVDWDRAGPRGASVL